MSKVDLARAAETARRAAEKGGSTALRWFKTGVRVETKLDQSPVTQADKDSEAAIVAEIRRDFPDHDLLTEESGAKGQGSEYRWIVDPLDGTKGFIRGGAFWGPIVALEERGQIVAGAMAMPVLEEVYWAGRGQGAFRNGSRLSLSSIEGLDQAALSLGELRGLTSPPHGPGVLQLIRSATVTRCYGDVAGCAMLLNGQADLWVEAGVQIWDIAGLMILVEEAGGRFTDLEGRPTVTSGNAIAGNARIHQRALEVIAAAR
jgi:histidinol-phosphatase